MRNATHRLRRTALSGAVAVALATGAVAPAVAENIPDAADTANAVEIARKKSAAGPSELGSGSSDLGSLTNNSFSSRVGADGLQTWYDGSPGWARALISVVAIALALDVLGVLIGPVRSMLFNLLPR